MHQPRQQNRSRQRTGQYIAIILAVSLLVHVLSLIVGATRFAGWIASNYPIHAAIEMAGSVIAFVVAHQLVMLNRRAEGTSFDVPIVGALIAMGIFDGLHAMLSAGNSFVFLHSLAGFCGGILFALVWLPVRWQAHHMRTWLWVVPSIALSIGALAVVVPDLVPAMVRDGRFTLAAVFLNITGGLLMFAAAGRMVISYRQTGNIDDLIFCLHCALFGAASVMFEQSALWDFAWWSWHLLRLMAYAVALWFIILNSGRTVENIVSAARNQELMRAALNAANEAMLTFNSQGQIVDANQAACLRLGYERDTLLSLHAWELEVGGTGIKWKRDWEAIRCNEFDVLNSVYQTRSGQRFPVEISRTLVRFHGDEFICDLARDISERLQKETELKQFKTTLERISDCVFIFDEQTLRFTYANSHALEHIGYSAAELFKLTPLDIKPEFTPSRFRSLIRPLVTQRRDVVRHETNHRHKNGHLIAVEGYLHYLTDDDGAGRFVITARDISERRHYEAALEQARRTAEQASLAKSQFLANMSHELRTPLNGVIGMTELLIGTSLTGQQREFIDACRKSGESRLQLINRILDFSKIEAGKLELDLHAFSLVKLVSDTVDTMRWRAATKGLTTPWHVDRLARHTLMGDSGRLRQVLVNLIGNAIKFTEAGSVTVHVRQIDRRENQTTLRFSVSDTGMGVPTGKQHRLFETFSQIDSSTSRQFGGTGLGLSICRSLVELMGGTIGVRSAAGSGSTFWFDLPFEIASPGEAAALQRSPAAEQRFNGRVLVGEDNEINQMYIATLLKKLGCECTTAVNGLEVIDALQTNRFDLVLMDCQMPQMDGFEATRQIRRLEKSGVLGQRIPIIALTANAIKGDREQCLDAGMDDYLSKPVRIEEVSTALARYLDAAVPESPGDASESHASSLVAADEPANGPQATLPIDPRALLERCIGNLEFAESLLDELGATGSRQVEEIRMFSSQGKTTATANAAHALKGATGILCAQELCRLASDIEQASRKDQLSDIEIMIRDLAAEMDRCLSCLPEVRSSMQALKEGCEQ